MLIDFTMRNFKSFKKETILSAETGERLTKYKDTNTMPVGNGSKSILKNLLIFGPNSAGKSNLLDGLKQMQKMVLNDPQTVTDKLETKQFDFSPVSSSSDIYFGVTFASGECIYKYDFSYNENEITSEELSELCGHTKQKVIFSRKDSQFKTSIKQLKEVFEKTKKNSLVLYTAMQNNIAIPTMVFTWFAKNLIFADNYKSNVALSDLISLVNTETIKNQLLKFLHFADLNIIDLKVNHRDVQDFNSGQIKRVNELLTIHKVYDEDGNFIGKQSMSMDDESRGTQKILMIALSFINAELSGSGKTLLFDEFDDSLHLELSQAMVKIFNSKANKNQFVLTTHELKLLDSEVRVDQIYLVDKDFKGESSLTSIFDFKDTRNTTRGGISYMKRYIEGRFGATPIIETDEMLKALTSVEVSKAGE